MSNGTVPLSGTNLTHPTSGKTEIIRDIKGAIKSSLVLGLREAFKYTPYEQFRDLKITTDFPIRNTDYPCIVILLRNLSIKQISIDRRTRVLEVMTSDGIKKLREERRAFDATIGLYHAAYTTGEMNYLSDALADILSFDSGRYLSRFVDANVPGIAYLTDNLMFSGEMQEIAPEGERYIYSDVLSVPIYGEVIMRAWYAIVDGVEVKYAILGGGETIIEDYPEGWDW